MHMRNLFNLMILLVFVCLVAMPAMADEGQNEEHCQKACGSDTTIAVREIEPYDYVALEMTGTYDQHGQAFQTLYTSAGEQGLPMGQMPFGIYWNSPDDTAEEDLKWEIGFPQAEAKEVSEPLKNKKWEFTSLAVTTYKGTFGEDQAAAYQALFMWIGKNGYKPAGPVMEKYLCMPRQTEDGGWEGCVEIMVPVEKAQK